MKILARHMKALRKIADAQKNDGLPFQSKAKIFQELVDGDLAMPHEILLRGRFPVRMRGFCLTPTGKYIVGEKS